MASCGPSRCRTAASLAGSSWTRGTPTSTAGGAQGWGLAGAVHTVYPAPRRSAQPARRNHPVTRHRRQAGPPAPVFCNTSGLVGRCEGRQRSAMPDERGTCGAGRTDRQPRALSRRRGSPGTRRRGRGMPAPERQPAPWPGRRAWRRPRTLGVSPAGIRVGRPSPVPDAQHGVQPALGRRARLHPAGQQHRPGAGRGPGGDPAACESRCGAADTATRTSYPGNPGGVIIDMSQMHGVSRSPTGRSGWKAAALTGTCTPEALQALRRDAAGRLLLLRRGGRPCGRGWLRLAVRQLGLTVDYLSAVELVVVSRDRSALVVTARRDDPRTADLLWGHTGGGGGTSA